ncbi:MAG: ribokinase [Acidimicrobiia bacterium]|nr:ribokinase [Acidimicrobiia bacterium]MDX2466448.1 ribokinase [Acidimicrobiia bacterium]
MNTTSPTVCVVGSTNVDLVVTGQRLPAPGETVSGGLFSRSPGGKGANQALASQRQGARVTFIGAVGDDPLATEALQILREDAVDLSGIVTVSGSATGVALIAIDAAGENQISVAPGANHKLQPSEVNTVGFDDVICQLEINDATVSTAAMQATGLFCLNAAPARPIPQVVVDRADVIIVNETEHASLIDQLDQFPRLLVVTKGAAGADAYRSGELVASGIPPVVEAIDTVGAGDSFCGSFVVALARGLDVAKALERACAAGAIAATRTGAQTALPTAAEVDALM